MWIAVIRKIDLLISQAKQASIEVIGLQTSHCLRIKFRPVGEIAGSQSQDVQSVFCRIVVTEIKLDPQRAITQPGPNSG